jgi:hypothetical protein
MCEPVKAVCDIHLSAQYMLTIITNIIEHGHSQDPSWWTAKSCSQCLEPGTVLIHYRDVKSGNPDMQCLLGNLHSLPGHLYTVVHHRTNQSFCDEHILSIKLQLSVDDIIAFPF